MKRPAIPFVILVLVALAALFVPSLGTAAAPAQPPGPINSGDVAWMLTASGPASRSNDRVASIRRASISGERGRPAFRRGAVFLITRTHLSWNENATRSVA